MNDRPSRSLTFLFTDIEGSTRKWDRDQAAMAVALVRHDALLRAAIEANGGRIFKTVGDAFCAAFHDPADAVAAAVATQRALAAEPWPEATGELRVRSALHTGDAEERDADFFGPAVNRVARLLSTGHGGQLLLSRATADALRDRLPDGCTLLDLGGHRLKDLSRPEHVFQLVAPDLPAEFPPLKSLDARPNNLPVQPTALIGREREAAEATGLLEGETARLLTLTGPGGTGKTRLGLQIAADLADAFPDGVWFVDLSALRDPDLVVTEVARSLGVREEGRQPLRERLAEALRDEQVLLVLDNFEHVLAAASDVAALLAGCPKLKILATSRAPLRLRGERELPVPPLPVPDPLRLPPLDALAESASVRLFAERARAANPAWELTADNAAAVAAICARLDGLPLALELAAARSRLLAPAALLGRLEQRLTTLTRASRDLPERQQTMRAAIAWSHDLLTAEQRALFRRLAVFAGGWTFEAAEAVAPSIDEPDVDVLAGLEELVEQSLVRQEEPEAAGEAAAGLPGGISEPRFRMLETIREFGLELLVDSGEADAVRAAHAACYLDLAEHAETWLRGPDQGAWLDRLEAEHDNLRAALDWLVKGGVPEQPLRLAGALGRFWHVRGYVSEGDAWLERALASGEGVPFSVRAKALTHAGALAGALGDFERATARHGERLALCQEEGDRQGVAVAAGHLGNVARMQGDFDRAAVLYTESLAAAREVGDQHAIATSLYNLGTVASDRGEYARARPLLAEALAVQRELGDSVAIANTLNTLGSVASHQSEFDRAAALCEESLTVAREVGDKPRMVLALNNLGVVAWKRGDDRQAVAWLEEGLALQRDLGDRAGVARSLFNLGAAAQRHGENERAAALHEEALALRRALGDRRGIASSLHSLGIVAAAQGDHARAGALGQESLDLCRELGAKGGVGQALLSLGRVAFHEGAHRRAGDHYRESLGVFREIGDKLSIVECLESFAEDLPGLGRLGDTARLYGAAAALREAIGSPLTPGEQSQQQQDVDAIREQLGADVFLAAWEAGRALSLDEAVADALALADTLVAGADQPRPRSSSPLATT